MIIVYILVALVGLCVGSFLNVLIYRVPNGLSIVKPASHCPVCKQPIKWYDNIPVISFLVLGGKCRHCKTPISLRYMIIELSNMLLWLICALVFWKTNVAIAIISMVATSVFLVIACIDLEHKYIPDRFQIALLVLGVLVCVFDSSMTVWTHVIGLAVGAGIMGLFYGLGWLIYKKEALGVGDIKLMAVCGLILGWQATIVAIFVGAIAGAIGILITKALSKKEEIEYAFAPYLLLGVTVALFLGQTIINGYLSIIS